MNANTLITFVRVGSILLFSSLQVEAGQITKSKVAAVKNVSNLRIQGKLVPLTLLSRIAPLDEVKITKPEIPSLPPNSRLILPNLTAGVSAPTVQVPNAPIDTKLSPLVRYAVDTEWSGQGLQPLSQQAPPTLTPLVPPQVVPMEVFTEGEFKILEALLLLQKEDTSALAIGLSQPLLQSTATVTAAREILARGYLNRKLRNPALEHLLTLYKLTGSNPSSRSSQWALTTLLQQIKTSDYEVAIKLSPQVEKLPEASIDFKNLALAEARLALEAKDLQKAWDWLERVKAQTPQTYESQFLQAMILYRSNEPSESRKILENLLKDSDKMPKDIRSIAAATLAQIYFQQSQYKKALQTYRLIDQEHPLWLQSLVESAWSQILNKDYEGAAGNMFSLHTNFFKGAYNPESYIARTVGYLQLCQYGDALAVLKDFLRKYRFAQKQLATYKQKNPNHLDTIRAFLKAGMPKSYAGLPRSLLVEVARDPKFIELQKKINELEEDGTRFENLGRDLETMDKKFAAAHSEYATVVKDLDRELKNEKNVEKKQQILAKKREQEQLLNKQLLLRRIVLEAKQGITAESKLFASLWLDQKNNFKLQQNNVIQASMVNLEKDLTHWLDQSELLFYEIHNGAGEHLRYQMATTDEKQLPGNKPSQFKKTDKDLQWAFDGEIWEDEVGHYRSSLKNVCPEDEKTQASGEGSGNATSIAQLKE